MSSGISCDSYCYPKDDPYLLLYFDCHRHPKLKTYFSDDGSFVLIDGEIYNFGGAGSEGALSLKNQAAKLWALYRAHGDDLFQELDGVASIVLWDARHEKLFCVRDRWGAVPSYFKEKEGVLVWCSSLPAVLKVTGFEGINRAAMDYYLGTGHLPAPWSLAQGISKLKPAHLITAKRNSAIRVARYFKPTGRPKFHLSAEEVTDRLDSYFKESLKRRVREGEKIGVLLSGGVDSKLLAGQLQAIGQDFDCYTFRYSEYEGEFNEGGEAKKAADHLGVPYHDVEFGPRDISHNFDTMIRNFGEPFGYGLHSSMLQRIGTNGEIALLNGAGPDRWYLHLWDRLSLGLAAVPEFGRNVLTGMIPILRKVSASSQPALLKNVYYKIGRLAHGATIITWGLERRISPRFIGIMHPEPYRHCLYFDDEWLPEAHEEVRALLEETRNEFDDESDRDAISFTAQQYFPSEGILTWNHWWGEASGLQVRFPYFDSEFYEFVMRLARRGKDKDDMRHLARKFLGPEMSHSPKIGQTIPLQGWFRNELRDFVRDQLSENRVIDSGLFDPETVSVMVNQHIEGKADHAWHIWPMMAVLKWQELARSGDW